MHEANDRKASASAGSVRGRRHASALPDDAVAVIRPNEPTSSGGAKAKNWSLSFRPRSPPRIEPLMGWTETTDTLQQVRLQFPTAEAAIGYCERQGLQFDLQGGAGAAAYGGRGAARPLRSGDEDRSAPPANGESAADDERPDLDPEAVYPCPDAVLADNSLTRDQKRAILRSWEWDEYLLDLEAAEAPVRDNVSRLAEVRSALARLDADEVAETSLYRWEPRVAA